MNGSSSMDEDGAVSILEMDWSSSMDEDGEAAIGGMYWTSSMEEDGAESIGEMDITSGLEEGKAAMEAAATKIQAVFRGFNVRRRKPLIHLRKIASVRRELTDLQVKAGDPAYIERICVDVMECRKMTEGIMALLLRLDAIQGVHPVVRDIRKGVNREVVQFMEVIDAVVVGAATSPWQDTRNTPNMGRSNSVSHLDRVSSHSLKRMHSLDNCNYPGQSHKRQDDSPLKFENRKEVGGENITSFAGRADHSLDGASSGPKHVLARESQEEMGDHSEFEALRALTAALIIQSSFRGYRVRRCRPLKHLRTIAQVRAKLRELTGHVSSPSFHSKLRSDNMERLRMTESITALLLQLDSVQGVDQEIRDIRKSVTRDVIKLQELVDTLISNLVEGRSALPSNVTESQDSWKLAGSSAGEDVANDSLSRHGTGHESMDDKVGPTTPELDEQNKDMDLDDGSIPPCQEKNCPAIELDRLQVRALHNATASCASEIAEGNRLSDQESGPCAAAVSDKDNSSGIAEEHAGTFPALKSHHRSVEEVCAREPLCEDMSTPKVGNRQWHDKFVDVLDVEARACKLSESAPSDDLQAQALDISQKTTVRNGVFVRDIYDSIMMTSVDNSLKSSTPEYEYESRKTEEPAGSNLHDNCLEGIEFLSDDRAPASITLSDRSVSDDHTSDGTVLSDNCTPAGNYPSPTDHWVPTGNKKLSYRTIIDDFFPAENARSGNHTPAGPPGNHQFLIDDYVPGGFDATYQSRREDFVPPGYAQIDRMDGENHDGMSTLASSSSTDGSLHASDVTSMSEVVSGREQHGEPGSKDVKGQLADENAKLKALLNQVLIFAEMQSAMVSAVKETNEKLEGEIIRYKKREDVWRKKSKSARRRR